MAKAKKDKSSELEKLDIDKESIVKEIKNEVKEQLLEEVTKKIDYETQNKLDKMEKRIYKSKNFSIFKRNVIILIFLGVIIYEAKILYDNGLLFGLNKKEVVNNIVDKADKESNETKEEEKDLAWYIDKYSYLLDNIKTNLEEDRYYLYNDNYTKDSIDNKVRLNMAYQILDSKDKKVENSVISVEAKKLKEAYKKIFGDTENYENENFIDNCIQFIYNGNTNVYMAIDTNCNVYNEQIIKEIENIYIEDDTLVIEVLIGIYNKDTKTLTNINNEIIKEDYSLDNLDDVKDSMNKYKYIFSNVDNEYYLKEIKKD